MADGCPTFPDARYLIAQTEWDYWRAAGPAAFVFTGDYIPTVSYQTSIGDESVLASDLALEAAPGHTH